MTSSSGDKESLSWSTLEQFYFNAYSSQENVAQTAPQPTFHPSPHPSPHEIVSVLPAVLAKCRRSAGVIDLSKPLDPFGCHFDIVSFKQTAF